jgi:adenine specific DNA methylase Mod
MKSKKPNRTQQEKNQTKPKKPSQTKKTEPNRFFFQNNQTETGWLKLVSVRFWFSFQKLKTDFVIFF